MGITIKSIGIYVPSYEMKNYEFESFLDTSDEWIFTRTGIKSRYIAKEEDLISLSKRAALNALNNFEGSIDLIIVATLSPEYYFPSTACLVQKELGIKTGFAFDISAACSGFLYGLDLLKSYFESKKIKNALLIGAEKISSIIDWNDRTTAVLFGDGAGAVLMSFEGEGDILSSVVYSDGELADILYAKKCDSIKMNGKEVFKWAVRNMEKASLEALEKANLTPEDIDLVIPHQANIRIIKALAQRLNLSESKVFANVDKYANTSAASIPIALYDAYEKGILKRGHKVLLTAMGGGLTWGAAVIRF